MESLYRLNDTSPLVRVWENIDAVLDEDTNSDEWN
jgi:hypothetical protein